MNKKTANNKKMASYLREMRKLVEEQRRIADRINFITEQLSLLEFDDDEPGPTSKRISDNEGGYMVGDKVKERTAPAFGKRKTGTVVKTCKVHMYVKIDGDQSEPRRKHHSFWKLV